jgi:hypothetical protein
MLYIIYMQLIRTTIRLKEELKKSAERKALDDDMSFQDVLSRALEKYLEEEGKREARKIIFKTHRLGEPLDSLTRDDYYSDPQ